MTHIFSIPQSAGALWRKSRRTATLAAAGVAMVACSSSDLLEVQLEGKKRLGIAEFLRGTRIN